MLLNITLIIETLSSSGVSALCTTSYSTIWIGCSIRYTQWVTFGITVAALSWPGNPVLFTCWRTSLELSKTLWLCKYVLLLGRWGKLSYSSSLSTTTVCLLAFCRSISYSSFYKFFCTCIITLSCCWRSLRTTVIDCMSSSSLSICSLWNGRFTEYNLFSLS